jgi:hypothetical protein
MLGLPDNAEKETIAEEAPERSMGVDKVERAEAEALAPVKTSEPTVEDNRQGFKKNAEKYFR